MTWPSERALHKHIALRAWIVWYCRVSSSHMSSSHILAFQMTLPMPCSINHIFSIFCSISIPHHSLWPTACGPCHWDVCTHVDTHHHRSNCLGDPSTDMPCPLPKDDLVSLTFFVFLHCWSSSGQTWHSAALCSSSLATLSTLISPGCKIH